MDSRQRGSPTPSRGSAARSLCAAVWLGCVLASYSILKPIRDAMVAAADTRDVDVGILWSFTFAGTLLVAPLYALAAARMPRSRLIRRTYHTVALCLIGYLVAWISSDGAARTWVGRTFYVFVSVFNLFTVAVFWSASTDSFDREHAVRRFGPIAVGGTIGMFLGSTFTNQLAAALGTPTLLAISALLLELGLLASWPVLKARGDQGLTLAVPRGRDALRDLRAVFDSPLLWRLALYVVLMTFPSTVMYQESRHLIAGSGLDQDARTELYARVNQVTQGLTLLAQGLLVGPLIRRFGLRVGLAVLPLASVLTFGVLGWAAWIGTAVFWTQLIANSVIDALRHAIQKPSREILFTLAAPHERYAAKNVIDTVAHRGGDVLSVHAHGALAGAPLHAVMLAVVPVAAGWTWLGARLGGRADARCRALSQTPSDASP